MFIWSFESFCHTAHMFTSGRFRGSPAAGRNPKYVENYDVANADPPPRPRDLGLCDCFCRWSRDHFHKRCRRSRGNSLQVSARLSALDPTQQRTCQQDLAGACPNSSDWQSFAPHLGSAAHPPSANSFTPIPPAFQANDIGLAATSKRDTHNGA